MKKQDKTLLRQGSSKEENLKNIKLLKKENTTDLPKEPERTSDGAEVKISTDPKAESSPKQIAEDQLPPDDYKNVKQAWHNRVKKHTLRFYNQNTPLQSLIFFLIKEGTKYLEKLVLVPADDTDDQDLKSECLQDMCSRHKVVAFCSVLETYSAEPGNQDDFEVPSGKHQDNKDLIILTCESLEDSIVTIYELKDDKATFYGEHIENAADDIENYNQLCNLLSPGVSATPAN